MTIRKFTPTSSVIQKCLAAFVLILTIFTMSGCANQQSEAENQKSASQVRQFEPITAPKLSEVVSSDTDNIRKIVILNSYQKENVITRYYEEGIVEGLRLMGFIEGQNAEITHLYLNVKSDRDNLLTNTVVMVKQIQEIKPDILVTTDDDAIRFTRTDFFDQNQAVVFAGVNTANDGNDSALIDLMADSINRPGHNITGVLEKLPIGNNYRLLEQLFPEAKNILFISDNSSTSQEMLKMADIEAQTENRALKISHIYTDSYQQFKDSVQAYQSGADAIMVYLPIGLEDSEGNLVDEQEIAKWFAENNHIPEISFSESLIAGGVFSGWVVDYYQLGYHAGLMAGRIIEGEDPAEISIINPEAYTLYINANRTGQRKYIIPDNIVYQSSTNSKYYTSNNQ